MRQYVFAATFCYRYTKGLNEMIKVLSIGNSFSQDAQRYFFQIAKANGEEVKNVNLMVGGCTLKTHYINTLEDARAYWFEYKGEWVQLYASIKEALISDDWDYVTVQQASHKSFDYDSFSPYIEKLCEYIKIYAPKTKILIHNTWAYPDDNAKYHNLESSEDMYTRVKSAYERASKLIECDGIIPSGDAMIKAYRTNRDIVYRDTLHASLGFGRYMLGIVWFKYFFGEKEEFIHINEFDEPISDELKDLAYKIAYNK